MSFPSSPTNGQQTTLNGITYTYNTTSNSWTRVAGQFVNMTSLNLTNTIPSTSTTTGALKVAGGVGVAGNVYAAKFFGDGSGLTGITGGSSGISNLVEDLTPQLGGDLDLNGHIIQSATGLNVQTTTANLVSTLTLKNTNVDGSTGTELKINNDDESSSLVLGVVGSGWDQGIIPFFSPGDMYLGATPGYSGHTLWIFNPSMVGSLDVPSGNINIHAGGAVKFGTQEFTGSYNDLTDLPTLYSNVDVASYLTANPQPGTYTDSNVAAYTGNISAKINGQSIGYLEMPQVAAGNVTLALSDSGKHYYSTSTNPSTITVPTNSSVAFPTGTVITIVNQGTGNITVSNTGISLYLGGNSTISSRKITSYGVATLLKVATDTWFINGTGVV